MVAGILGFLGAGLGLFNTISQGRNQLEAYKQNISLLEKQKQISDSEYLKQNQDEIFSRAKGKYLEEVRKRIEPIFEGKFYDNFLFFIVVLLFLSPLVMDTNKEKNNKQKND